VELEANPRILYENGAAQYASIISRHFDAAIERVKTLQYGSFPNKASVFVPNSGAA
jgi:hypothetical protein